jgi:uncharacterized membrane protein
VIRAGEVGVVLGFLVLLCAIVSTGAGYAVDSPREATVVVAPDVTATLTFVESGTLDSGRQDAVPIITLTNRFPVTLTDITVTVSDPTEKVPRLVSYTGPESLQPGETAAVLADTICGGGMSDDWPVTVTATGRGVSVQLSRSVTVSCVFNQPKNETESMNSATTAESQPVTANIETTDQMSTETTGNQGLAPDVSLKMDPTPGSLTERADSEEETVRRHIEEVLM